MAGRKPRRLGPLWAWVLGALLLIVILWLLIALATGGEEAAGEAAARLDERAPMSAPAYIEPLEPHPWRGTVWRSA